MKNFAHCLAALTLLASPAAWADDAPDKPHADPTNPEDKPAADPADGTAATEASPLDGFYGVFLLSTASFQSDVGVVVGIGYAPIDELMIELDFGPTFIDDGGDLITEWSLVPGVIWAFTAIVYASARVIVPLSHDGGSDFTLLPGLGAVLPIGDSPVALFLEGHAAIPHQIDGGFTGPDVLMDLGFLVSM